MKTSNANTAVFFVLETKKDNNLITAKPVISRSTSTALVCYEL